MRVTTCMLVSIFLLGLHVCVPSQAHLLKGPFHPPKAPAFNMRATGLNTPNWHTPATCQCSWTGRSRTQRDSATAYGVTANTSHFLTACQEEAAHHICAAKSGAIMNLRLEKTAAEVQFRLVSCF